MAHMLNRRITWRYYRFAFTADGYAKVRAAGYVGDQALPTFTVSRCIDVGDPPDLSPQDAATDLQEAINAHWPNANLTLKDVQFERTWDDPVATNV